MQSCLHVGGPPASVTVLQPEEGKGRGGEEGIREREKGGRRSKNMHI